MKEGSIDEDISTADLSNYQGISKGSTNNQYVDPPDPDPPDPPGPGIPDPENITRRIGNFEDDKKGGFVSFDSVEEGISNHTFIAWEDVTLFESVTIDGLNVYEERSNGYVYQIMGDRGEIHVYDDASARLKFDVRAVGPEQQISFKAGELTPEEKQNGIVGMSNDGFSGSLIPYGSSKNDETLDLSVQDGFINYTVETKTSFIFRLDERRNYRGIEDYSGFINQGFSEGQIGAELRVEAVEDGFYQMPLFYGDMNLQSKMMNERTLRMMVSSSPLETENKLVVVDISSTVMNVSSPEDLEMTFDNESIEHVDSYSDLVEKSEEPGYTLLRGEEGIQVLVNVPHFSTHTITLQRTEEVTQAESEESYFGRYVYYLPAAMITACIVAFGILRQGIRKKE
ncbi:MAG: hypothetical protein KGY76_05370 [Candidatus Thermoplasmatota archaeon]|nr:hypothetical protein [Candidatus Thermoplasmatota archaeon]